MDGKNKMTNVGKSLPFSEPKGGSLMPVKGFGRQGLKKVAGAQASMVAKLKEKKRKKPIVFDDDDLPVRKRKTDVNVMFKVKIDDDDTLANAPMKGKRLVLINGKGTSDLVLKCYPLTVRHTC